MAQTRGWTPIILSAAHGFIPADHPISYYDQKLTAPYDGPWPDGEGYYLGGTLYFGRAPNRFRPLVPSCQQGEMVKAVYDLLGIKDSDRPTKGIVATMVAALLEGPKTKQDLRDLLDREFPHGNPKMHNTINIQLNQCRIGDERGFKLMRDGPPRGKRYWLVPKDEVR